MVSTVRQVEKVKPEFTDVEQRILCQIVQLLEHGLSSWVSTVDEVSESAGALYANQGHGDFTFAKMNLFAAREMWKLFGWSDYKSYPKKEWLKQEFPLVFGSNGVNGYTLSETAYQTEEKDGVKHSKKNVLSERLVDEYFKELNKLYKTLNKKVVDDLY